mgnify:CR=1 FL=1
MYELFVGPPELDAEWDDRGIDGVYRFLNRFWKLAIDSKEAGVAETKEMIKLRHKLVYDITQRLESFSLNTVISGFMEYNNKLIELAKKTGGIDKETIETFVKLLAPFAFANTAYCAIFVSFLVTAASSSTIATVIKMPIQKIHYTKSVSV